MIVERVFIQFLDMGVIVNVLVLPGLMKAKEVRGLGAVTLSMTWRAKIRP